MIILFIKAMVFIFAFGLEIISLPPRLTAEGFLFGELFAQQEGVFTSSFNAGVGNSVGKIM